MNEQDIEDKTKLPIRSFVIRSGRMTEAQRTGLDSHLEQWGLTLSEEIIDYAKAFNNQNPLIMEIGFGMGDSLATMAENDPDQNFIGVEVHSPGIGRLLSLVENQSIKNIRVFNDDAVKVLKQCTAEHSLSRLNLYFPDPWHKTKHHKRRLVQHDFLALIHSRLSAGGLFHFATDWQPYADYVVKLMSQQSLFENVAGDDLFVDPQDYGRPETKFERRGQRLGHGVWDMVFRALPNKTT
ncbi:MAG: tRNA (guanosine(46)-N7)-methyltransferase TrmB [Cellvibrionales bacterium]|nr:tRNA (guanosine(46)-N7)-methyltransferase TrmB [Cellvibrionales bacterium]